VHEVHVPDNFYRDKDRGLLGGVCAGLADYFGASSVLLRLIFILWALASAAGGAVYVLLWVFLPEKAALGLSRGETVRQNIREIGAEARDWGQDLQSLLGGTPSKPKTSTRRIVWVGALCLLAGLLFLADGLHLFGRFRLDQLGAVVLILVGAILVNRSLRS
jgi:phage shock protein PspC (stress-responsive transcriptional regulator)